MQVKSSAILKAEFVYHTSIMSRMSGLKKSRALTEINIQKINKGKKN